MRIRGAYSKFLRYRPPPVVPDGDYTTNFDAIENPISEGGLWINGGAIGLDWSNISVSANGARGEQTPDQNPPAKYNDSTALLAGTWADDQSVEVVVRDAAVDSGSIEVEIRLRSNLAEHSCTGYEIYWSLNSNNPYLIIGRWNGDLGDYTNLDSTSSGVTVGNGATLKATVVGTVITAYIDGQQKLQYDTASDNPKYSSGRPGMGFYLDGFGGDPSEQANFGFTSLIATDL